jgi:hypothetical protein
MSQFNKNTDFSNEQIEAGKKIINCFIEDPNGIRWVVLLAQMQSGKTDTFLFVCCELIRIGKVENAVIFSGNSETDLKCQLITKVQGQDSEFYNKYSLYLEDNEQLNTRQRQPIIEKIKQNISVIWGSELNKTNKIEYSKTLFVWEEAHYAQTVNQCPDKFLDKIGISANGDKIVLQEKENYVLSVSATPFSEYSDYYHFGQCKKIIYMRPGAGYNSVQTILESGRLKSFSNIETGLLTALSTPYDSTKYAIVRITNKNENTIKEIIRQFPSWKQVIYDSLGDSKTRDIGIETWKQMNNVPEQNTVILLRGKCRMGKNLEKKHIAFVMETVKSANTDTILQGLLGRVCGYSEGSDKIDVYLHNKIIKSNEIERYISLVNGESIIPSKATNIAKTTIYKTKYPIIPFKVQNMVYDNAITRIQFIQKIYNNISKPDFDFEPTDENQFEEIKSKFQRFLTKDKDIEIIIHEVSDNINSGSNTEQKWIDMSNTICKYESTNEICPKNLWHTGIETKGKKEGRIINVFYYKEAYETISANSAYIYGVTDTPNPHCQVMSGVIQTTKREVFCGKKINDVKLTEVLEDPQEEEVDVLRQTVDLYTKQKNETQKPKKIQQKEKQIDLNCLTKTSLLEKCEELGITRCKSKNKGELVELIKKYQKVEEVKVEEVVEIEEVFEITINPKRRKRTTSSGPMCNIYIENLNIIYVENVNIIVSNQEQQRKENNEIIILD